MNLLFSRITHRSTLLLFIIITSLGYFSYHYYLTCIEFESLESKSNSRCPIRHEKVLGNMLLKIDKNENCFGNCFLARREGMSELLKFCYPSIVVIGFPKCGTSFLFKALSKHPQIIATKRKELCLGGPMSETWWDFVNRLPSPADVRKRHVMSGCLHLGANIEATTDLCVTNTKYIFLVRDVADMLWAAYNYWCIVGIDKQCVPGGRTTKESVRSPEHFHQLVLTNQSMGGGTPLLLSGLCYKPDLAQAVAAFGRSNVEVLRSEDLQTHQATARRNDSFASLLSFLQLQDNFIPTVPTTSNNNSNSTTSDVLNAISWTDSVLNGVHVVNSGHSLSSRGEFVESSKEQLQVGGGRYEASGFKPMLRATRVLLHSRWREECLWLQRTWRVSYDACAD